ncbi:ATP-binding cassette domain-containing protein [Caldivirga maquilingensis]|uniref:ABC transporter related n=1 Tax=Caldivirga maquilingensis (strain ATCC 700844 / DSM 13496 / JCM 10307 / IC-167) TaxID=397948 RepID=A8M8U5_CALMQ|nr:ATP-binding cassette domain-containing protein [Caldivirga maquilingensis]ABW02164.1 ABC transporter related [Caldivirga maquilingensis IC-167]
MLVVSDLWARYGNGDWVLKGLSLSLKDGEVGLVIGDTGSGKTTLVRALTGVIHLTGGLAKGVIKVNGVELSGVEPRGRSRLIGVLYQDPAIHFTYPRIDEDLELTAIENNVGVKDLLKTAGLSNEVLGKLVTELSMGQLQRLAIAKLVTRGVKVIVMDEPLAHLDQDAVELLIALIRRIKRSGVSVLMLEHRYEHIIGSVDKILQLNGGKLSEPSNLSVLHRRRYIIRSVSDNTDHSWLKLSNVWFKYDDSYVLSGINLTASSSRVIFIGPNGSGKSTILKLILGVVKPSRGKVTVDYSRPVLYMPQDINVVMSMTDTVGELYLELAKAAGRDASIEDLERELKALEININTSDDPLHLSEGQKRVLMLIMAKLLKPTLMIIDEPTSGLSDRYRVELAEFINQSNLRVVMATQDLRFASLIRDSDVFYVRGREGYVAKVSVSEHVL